MRQLRIGDVEITSIVERDGGWRPPSTLIGWDEERHTPLLGGLEPEMLDASGLMVITYQTFVVRTPQRTILVDTCVGEDKQLGPRFDYPKQPWLDGLHALGLTVDDVDVVLCTHLHFDHCGWNTRLDGDRWRPTFPNATYVFHEREYAAWEQAVVDAESPQARVFAISCEPVVAAGQAILVDDGYALDDTLTLSPTPGHSPAHCCVEIESRGQRAVITGDLFHHGLQLLDPELTTTFCWDPVQAVRSRRIWLEQAAGQDLVVLPAHFPSPTAGRIEASAGAFRYRYRR